jgi:hypothetical protein
MTQAQGQQGFFDGIQGTPDAAFSKMMVDVLPNGTRATAKVVKAFNQTGRFGDTVQIEWELTGGDYKSHHLFQKLYIFDGDPNRATKARNMLKLIMDLFHVKHDNAPPPDLLLVQMTGKYAGLKITEWQMQREDGSVGHGNSIAEVHPCEGFACETGTYREFKQQKGVESALTRNVSGQTVGLDDDVPF